MKLPEYINAGEVKRVCDEIGLRDWSQITDPTVLEEEMEIRSRQRIEVGDYVVKGKGLRGQITPRGKRTTQEIRDRALRQDKTEPRNKRRQPDRQ